LPAEIIQVLQARPFGSFRHAEIASTAASNTVLPDFQGGIIVQKAKIIVF
jgi:hypothetical protein